jgi:hypothetical protein
MLGNQMRGGRECGKEGMPWCTLAIRGAVYGVIEGTTCRCSEKKFWHGVNLRCHEASFFVEKSLAKTMTVA